MHTWLLLWHALNKVILLTLFRSIELLRQLPQPNVTLLYKFGSVVRVSLTCAAVDRSSSAGASDVDGASYRLLQVTSSLPVGSAVCCTDTRARTARRAVTVSCCRQTRYRLWRQGPQITDDSMYSDDDGTPTASDRNTSPWLICLFVLTNTNNVFVGVMLVNWEMLIYNYCV